MVVFSCTLPNTNTTTTTTTQTLSFDCKEPSCGVLNEQEVQEQASHVDDDDVDDDDENEVAMDPFFFEQGYTLAGKTGWQVWPGSRIVVDGLLWPQPATDSSRLQYWQQRLLCSSCDNENDDSSTRILELGAGVGVVGSCLAAAAGAQVLETDLSILVENSVRPNLQRNSDNFNLRSDGDDNGPPPDWLSSSGPMPMGRGWVGTAALDWTKPLETQLSEDQCQVDIVIASDCVWLMSMLDGVLSTVKGIFETSKRPSPTLLLSFQRRDPKDGESSLMFTSVDRILQEIQETRHWKVDCLGWSPVKYEDQEEVQEVFLFEVTPS